MLTPLTWAELAVIALVALVTSACLLLMSRRTPLRASFAKAAVTRSASTPFCFEFREDGAFVCANESATRLLFNLESSNPNWQEFRDLFIDRFHSLPLALDPSSISNVTVFPSRSHADPMELVLERHRTGTSIRIQTYSDCPDIYAADAHHAFSNLNDLDLMRAVCEQAPHPIWQTLPDGSVGWANTCYKALEQKIGYSAERQNEPLFQLNEQGATSMKPTRLSLQDKAHNRTYWFDVSHHLFGTSTLNYAMDIHAVVNAESAQRNFVQTLAKTFAHLTTGLAIFDRNRQLMLFNPSLIDLTELRPEFLTARPNLFAFFDQLRDNQVMPEPKNYSNWREQIADMISAASDDNFNETWHLPNGLTYRITGRPHPDGAIAFLFEDISAEISLTRRFRSEASVTRSALDALGDNLTIFNAAGFVQQCNRPMMAFMALEKNHPVDQMTVQDVTRNWQGKCFPSPVWGEIRDFILGESDRETWEAELQHKDGRTLNVQVSPIASGATLVIFSNALADTANTEHKRITAKPTKTVAA